MSFPPWLRRAFYIFALLLISGCQTDRPMTQTGLCARETDDDGRSILVVNTTEELTNPATGRVRFGAMCSTNDGPCSLRAALQTARLCGEHGRFTVRLDANETYDVNFNHPRELNHLLTGTRNRRIDATKLPEIVNNVRIEGNGAVIRSARIDGYFRNGRAFVIRHIGSLTLDGLTIEGFSAAYLERGDFYDRGAAVLNEGGLLRTRRVVFTRNSAFLGGAVYNDFGSGEVVLGPDTTFLENSGRLLRPLREDPSNPGRYVSIPFRLMPKGAAIYNTGGVKTFGTQFTENHTAYGVALYNTGRGSAHIYGGWIRRNFNGPTIVSAPTYLPNSQDSRRGGYLHLDAVSIQENGTREGGPFSKAVIIARDATVLIERSTISNNIWPYYARDIAPVIACYSQAGRLTIVDTTIVTNQGRGVQGFSPPSSYQPGFWEAANSAVLAVEGCRIALQNSIIAQHRANDCGFREGGVIREDSASMDSDGTCDTQLTATRTLIPSGERRSDGYHGVYLSEEARDRGEYCLDTDQLGRPRPQGACDIGAIEWQEDN